MRDKEDLGAELFALVEKEQGWFFISDGIEGMPREQVLSIARVSLTHTMKTARILRDFIAAESKRHA